MSSPARAQTTTERRTRPLRAEGHRAVEVGRAVAAPSRLTIVDAAVHRVLVDRSLLVLRWAVGAVFLYFGALKLIPGHSPAEDLVMQTIKAMTFDLAPGRAAVAFTGVIECALGVLLITGWFRRLTIYVLGLELLGILAPLVLLPSRLFASPVTPTLEGQYVLKDFTLVAAGMVLAATIRGGRLVPGPHSAQPTSRSAGVVSADEKLRIVLESLRADQSTGAAAAANGITPEEFRRWRDELLDGAVAAMASPQGRGGR
ncbi:MAG: DoxX family protein [Acidimicrobiales bacterium]